MVVKNRCNPNPHILKVSSCHLTKHACFSLAYLCNQIPYRNSWTVYCVFLFINVTVLSAQEEEGINRCMQVFDIDKIIIWHVCLWLYSSRVQSTAGFLLQTIISLATYQAVKIHPQFLHFEEAWERCEKIMQGEKKHLFRGMRLPFLWSVALIHQLYGQS